MSRAAPWLAPAYLLLCLLAGGSNQAPWANFALQIVALGLLVAAVAWPSEEAKPLKDLGALPMVALAFLVLVLVELIPLPPAVWASLPGRGFLSHGFDLLAVPHPWAAWSIDPSASIATLMPLLVPVALLATVVRWRPAPTYPLVAALVTATLLGVLFGFLQVRSGGEHYYLYRFSSFGQAAGFFANSNHMGTLLLVSIPFVVALASDQLRARQNISQRGLVYAAAAGLGAVLLIAVLLNRSTALLLLGGPVILSSLAIPQWKRPGLRKWLAAVAGLTLLGAVVLGASQGKMGMSSEDSSIHTRVEVWGTSARAIGDFKLTGSGLGTFERAYRHYEDPGQVDLTYVNHAHNDYLELIVELGLAGLVLMALFLGWWLRRAVPAWRSADPYARAAIIGAATIMLHSLVDFPLRTSAIAALFAMCIGTMVARRPAEGKANPNDLWPSRHLVGD